MGQANIMVKSTITRHPLNRPRRSWQLRVARWILWSSIGIAVLAPLIANDRPLFCICDRQWHWPAFRSIAESLDWINPSSVKYDDCIAKVMPIIPFASSTLDPTSSGYNPPGTRSSSGMHWLGTDALGRDVMAGLIYGTRYAWIIGLGATLLAAMGGIMIGMMAGYWKNNLLKATVAQYIALFIMIALGSYYYMIISWMWVGWTWLLVMILYALVWGFILYWLWVFCAGRGRLLPVPVDHVIMRGIDVFESFPKMFLLMALMVIFIRPSALALVGMIALIRWPLFVQIARAETLKESTAAYVISAQNIGVTWYHIMFRHIWPNIKPALITTAIFSISASVLLEASLSFIGLGLRLERTTWGSLLNEGRQYLPGWWLAVFPGFAIFILILALNWAYVSKANTEKSVEQI